MKALLTITVSCFLPFVTNSQSAISPVVPAADHHQHIFSPALVEMLAAGQGGLKPILASDLIAHLDSAGIRSAVLLSVAYIYGRPATNVPDEYTKVKAENDWTGAQASQYPDRLRAFFSLNPLKEYALVEIERCARNPRLRHGLKLHFGNSDVQLENPAHLEQLRRVFRTANEHRMAIIVHMRASISKGRPYDAQQARIFLEQLLPAAPDISVQIAHLCGAGPGYADRPADSALTVFVEAIAHKDSRTKNLWFDVTTLADMNISPDDADLLAKRIRQIGVNRILYGSDAATGNNLRPREGWVAFTRLPLTEEEFTTIARNKALYFEEIIHK
jgi:predicted TIM-barrel fold metal-dependent hydrolase